MCSIGVKVARVVCSYRTRKCAEGEVTRLPWHAQGNGDFRNGRGQGEAAGPARASESIGAATEQLNGGPVGTTPRGGRPPSRDHLSPGVSPLALHPHELGWLLDSSSRLYET